MDSLSIAIIFFFYGLAFFSMGLAIILELGHGSDQRLRHALRPLAAFGLVHGFHEWLEMFLILELLPVTPEMDLIWESIRLVLLAFSFISLAAFGAALLARDVQLRRFSLLVPIILIAIWAFGLLIMQGKYGGQELWTAADVWTRYTIGIPAAIIASLGLIFQQREFRREGMAQFGRDSLWAAIAFFWYGMIGQLFTRTSPLFPSTIINQQFFLETFGFPVQLLRAVAAIFAAFFVMRFLRSFEVELRRKIDSLQATQLQDAQRREAQRGEVLRRIVSAQETERQRIARELHDETGQALTAIGMGLRGASTILTQDVDKSAHHLRQLEGLVESSLVELQRLISDLRPSHLDDLGLAATLRWYSGEIQARMPLHVNFDVRGEPFELPSEGKTALFRIAQEALNNVVKHAKATEIKVVLFYEADRVGLQVSDNGRGFVPDKIDTTNRPTWGLMGMEERATLLGGSFQITSSPGEGTTVEVVIPIKPLKGDRQ